MKKSSLAISLLAAALASGTAFAQAPAPGTMPTKAADSADAKFVTADKDKSGMLEGAELDAFKADLAKIDTNKDGKVSKDEFAAAMKAGVIK